MSKKRRNVNRISLLPDPLIHNILSCLPIQDTVRTCVLSKRWKTIWTCIPKIKFDFVSYVRALSFNNPTLNFQSKVASFKHLVLGVLSQHCGIIQKLSYSSSKELDSEDRFFVEFLVFYARCHKVKKIYIDILDIKLFDWKFCFKGYRSLTVLKMTCGFVDDWGSLMLSSLKILEIDSGYENMNDRSILFNKKMFSGCPNLESLVVYDYLCENFGICAQKLRNLKLCCTSPEELHFIELQLSTPKIQCVKFTNIFATVSSTSDFSYLDKVNLEIEDFKANMFDKPKLLKCLLKFLQAFHNARSLTLPFDILKVLLSYRSLNGCLSFSNLINLKLKTNDTKEMIDFPVGLSLSFPFLNTLVVDLP